MVHTTTVAINSDIAVITKPISNGPAPIAWPMHPERFKDIQNTPTHITQYIISLITQTSFTIFSIKGNNPPADTNFLGVNSKKALSITIVICLVALSSRNLFIKTGAHIR